MMNAYAESVKKPQIETSEHAFKIILPNLNTPNEKTNSISKPTNPEEIILHNSKHKLFHF